MRRITVIILILLGIFLIVQAAYSLQWPIAHDEAPLFYESFLMRNEGRFPYRDIFDFQMPGSYIAYNIIGNKNSPRAGAPYFHTGGHSCPNDIGQAKYVHQSEKTRTFATGNHQPGKAVKISFCPDTATGDANTSEMLNMLNNITLQSEYSQLFRHVFTSRVQPIARLLE